MEDDEDDFINENKEYKGDDSAEELVKVISTGKRETFLVAESILKSADIEYFPRGAFLNTVLSGEINPNQSINAMEIFVYSGDADDARELLKEIDESGETADADNRLKDKTYPKVILLISALVILVMIISVLRC